MRKSLMVSFMGLLLASFAMAFSVPARAESAAEIDARVAAALSKFRKEVKGADDYLQAAKGVLVGDAPRGAPARSDASATADLHAPRRAERRATR